MVNLNIINNHVEDNKIDRHPILLSQRAKKMRSKNAVRDLYVDSEYNFWTTRFAFKLKSNKMQSDNIAWDAPSVRFCFCPTGKIACFFSKFS